MNFYATREETHLIREIVGRALMELDGDFSALTLTMDITATHANGNPLDLQALLEAPLADFGHDIYGIQRHIDRNTGELRDCFQPRLTDYNKLREEKDG